MSSVTFSSDGADVITRQLEGGLSLDGASRSPEEIEAFYELERCSAFITSNDYQRVKQISYCVIMIMYGYTNEAVLT